MVTRTITNAIEGKESEGITEPPIDAISFGWCYDLLQENPTYKEKLWMVSDRHPEWIPFVDSWKEQEQIYEKFLCFTKMSIEGRMELMKQRYFVDQYRKLNNNLEALAMIGKYLDGFKMDGRMNSWVKNSR